MSPQARGRRPLPPGRISPGEHLRAEMERLGLNQVSLSKRLGVTRQTVNNVVTGRQAISRAMSAGLGRLTHRPADYWLQNSFGTAPSAGVQKLLIKEEILQAVEQGRLGLVPFRKQRLRPACIELTLGGLDVNSARTPSPLESLRLRPRRSALVRTAERLDLPAEYLARLGVTPEFARTGLAAFHQLQIEPGFSGKLSVAIFNAGNADIVLRIGAPVFALEIVALGSSPFAA